MIFCKDTQLECAQDSLERVGLESKLKSIRIIELQEQVESWAHPTKNKCKKKKKCLEGTSMSNPSQDFHMFGPVRTEEELEESIRAFRMRLRNFKKIL